MSIYLKELCIDLKLFRDAQFLHTEEQDMLAFERSLNKAWSSIERVWQRTVEHKSSVSLIIDS